MSDPTIIERLGVLKRNLYSTQDESAIVDAIAEITRLTNENERKEMQIVACGTVAFHNTPESYEQNVLPREHPYWSQMYDDVCQAVKREMALRADNAAKDQEIRMLMNQGAVDTGVLSAIKRNQTIASLRAELTTVRAERDEAINSRDHHASTIFINSVQLDKLRDQLRVIRELKDSSMTGAHHSTGLPRFDYYAIDIEKLDRAIDVGNEGER